MKKKIIYMFLVFIFPLVIYADSVSLECPEEVKANSEFTCNIIGNSDTNVTDVDLTVTNSGNITFLSFSPANNWFGDGASGKITLYSDGNFNGKFNIGTLKYRMGEDEANTVTIEQATFFENKKQISLNPISAIVKLSVEKPAETKEERQTSNDENNDSNENDETTFSSKFLIDIVIDNYSIDFDKTVNEYELVIGEEDSLNIQPILEDNSSSVEVIGNSDLKDGSVISIVVTDENNETNTYTINIVKEKKTGDKNNGLIFAIIIGVLVIINILRVVMNSKKKKVNGDS